MFYQLNYLLLPLLAGLFSLSPLLILRTLNQQISYITGVYNINDTCQDMSMDCEQSSTIHSHNCIYRLPILFYSVKEY